MLVRRVPLGPARGRAAGSDCASSSFLRAAASASAAFRRSIFSLILRRQRRWRRVAAQDQGQDRAAEGGRGRGGRGRPRGGEREHGGLF